MKLKLKHLAFAPAVALTSLIIMGFGGCEGESSTGGGVQITGDGNQVCIINGVAGEDVKSPDVDCYPPGMEGIPDDIDLPGES